MLGAPHWMRGRICTEKELALHAIVIMSQLLQFSLNILAFFSNECRERISDFPHDEVKKSAPLKALSLQKMLEPSCVLEFSLQFLTPFGEYSQDLRILNPQAMGSNLFLTKGTCRLRQLSSNQIMGILFYLLLILIFVFFSQS